MTSAEDGRVSIEDLFDWTQHETPLAHRVKVPNLRVSGSAGFASESFKRWLGYVGVFLQNPPIVTVSINQTSENSDPQGPEKMGKRKGIEKSGDFGHFFKWLHSDTWLRAWAPASGTQ